MDSCGVSKLLSVYTSKCKKKNKKWKYIYWRLIWRKMWGIWALMPKAWRLNVGVCSCNVSTCSSQFCLVWLRVPLIFQFRLAARRRTPRQTTGSLLILLKLCWIFAAQLCEFVNFMGVEVAVLFTVCPRCRAKSDSFWIWNRCYPEFTPSAL